MSDFEAWISFTTTTLSISSVFVLFSVFCYFFEGVLLRSIDGFFSPKGAGVRKLPGSASDSNFFIIGALSN